MTPRVCGSCGVPEARGLDGGGRETVNLNPLTGLCLDCTVAVAMNTQAPDPEPIEVEMSIPFDRDDPEDAAFDARAAAANDREDA